MYSTPGRASSLIGCVRVRMWRKCSVIRRLRPRRCRSSTSPFSLQAPRCASSRWCPRSEPRSTSPLKSCGWRLSSQPTRRHAWSGAVIALDWPKALSPRSPCAAMIVPLAAVGSGDSPDPTVASYRGSDEGRRRGNSCGEVLVREGLAANSPGTVARVEDVHPDVLIVVIGRGESADDVGRFCDERRP